MLYIFDWRCSLHPHWVGNVDKISTVVVDSVSSIVFLSVCLTKLHRYCFQLPGQQRLPLQRQVLERCDCCLNYSYWSNGKGSFSCCHQAFCSHKSLWLDYSPAESHMVPYGTKLEFPNSIIKDLLRLNYCRISQVWSHLYSSTWVISHS